MKRQFVLKPAIKDAALPFSQHIELVLNGQTVGTARWHAPEGTDGIIQITDLAIHPDHQRHGHGSTLLKKCYAEAYELFAAHGIKPRRVWMILEQKRQVIARAFLSKHGYQHVSTMTALYKGQDGMLYQRSFD